MTITLALMIKWGWSFITSYLVLMFLNASMLNIKRDKPENLTMLGSITALLISLAVFIF